MLTSYYYCCLCILKENTSMKKILRNLLSEGRSKVVNFLSHCKKCVLIVVLDV